MSKGENKIIIEYFKSLRDEIHIRIQEHTRLVWIKIVSLGVMIYFLVLKCYDIEMGILHLKPPLLSLVYIIPLTAIISDFLIAGNIRDINNLGYYIKVYIENGAFEEMKDVINKRLKEKNLFEWKIDNGFDNIEILKGELKKNGFSIGSNAKIKEIEDGYKIVDEKRVFIVKIEKNHLSVKHLEFGFWENKAGQSALKYHCYTLWDILVIWLFTFASGIFSILFRRQNVSNLILEVILTVILVIGILFALEKLYSSIKMERRF